ncbi:MAG TPA: c-type cytochrome [Chitinophagaceae bacterium]|nr:c-type cytochrome [Chitinophagaceae bacterium]
MKYNWKYAFVFLFLTIVLLGCKGNSSNKNNLSENQSISNVGSDSSMVESPAPLIDVTAKSNSKGVGKFSIVKIGSINGVMASKGESLFQSKCTVCHKATSEKLIGPGLKGVTRIRTPEWIMNMLTNPAEMTDSDSIAEALLNIYHTQMVVQVSDDEARDILEYLRKNDNSN